MQLKQFTQLEELKSLDYSSCEPFIIMCQGKEIFCEKILRIIPKRRIVVKGLYDGQQVVIKIFISDQAKTHLEQEIKNYLLLEQHQFALPIVLLGSELAIAGVYVAIFTELYPVQRLQNLFQEQSATQVQYWLCEVQKLIIQLHTAGLMQADIHPDNFLIVSDTIYLIDFSSIEKIDEKDKLKNLALFYAQIPIKFYPLITELLTAYCQVCNKNLSEQEKDKFIQLVREMRWKRSQHFMKKCARDSSRFLMDSNEQRLYVCQRNLATPNLLNFLADPETFLQDQELIWLKKGRTCSVFKITIDQLDLVVKRYNIKSKRHFLTHFWKKSRAKKSWQFANLFNLFLLPTAKPIAFIEKYQKKLRTHSYYISEYISAIPLNEILIRKPDTVIVENTIKLINELGELRIAHGDMKATNFIVEQQEVYLIDFDAVKQHKNDKAWLEARAKDISRFRKNWLAMPSLMKKFDTLLRACLT